MDKSEMRRKYLTLLNAMPEQTFRERTDRISSVFLSSEEFAAAGSLAITVSRGREVGTRAIIEACWQTGKQVSVPKCDPSSKTMEFWEITSFSQLESVYLDLEEPITEACKKVVVGDIDLAVVPGVVFSANGFRIGYGGGYYDRFLAAFGGTAVSLAFERQMAPVIPAEPFDIPVGKIFTEERVIRCRQAD